jgi:hypothetical protein
MPGLRLTSDILVRCNSTSLQSSEIAANRPIPLGIDML